MSKVAVVYWSGTGNTEAMAKAVADGAAEKGAQVTLCTSETFKPSMIAEFDGLAFGCPSMGDEVLEESEFQPMWDDCKNSLGGKKVGLFGSYGWGDGLWMRNWVDECGGLTMNLIDDVICNEYPNDEGFENCKSLGAALV